MIVNDRGLREMQEKGLIAKTGSIQPASVDFHLGKSMKAWCMIGIMDPEIDQSENWHPKSLYQGRFFLQKGVLALAPTLESLTVPNGYVAMLHGLSSLGRMGLLVHVTAGLIDPGNSLVPTLELYSLASDIWLRPGMRICQVTYHTLTEPAEKGYDGKYKGDTEAIPSRMYKEDIARAYSIENH